MKPLNAPALSQELITFLKYRFPDKCPELSLSDREVWFKAGAAHVVAVLESELAKQEKTLLNFPTE